MNKEKPSKNCCIRMNEDLHAQAKIMAQIMKMSLQDWVSCIVKKEVESLFDLVIEVGKKAWNEKNKM